MGDYDHIDKIFDSTEQMILKDISLRWRETWNLDMTFSHTSFQSICIWLQNILINI